MSISYEILRFAKPTAEELKDITRFSPYDRYSVWDEDNDDYNPNMFIQLFRMDDMYAANLSGTEFAHPMELPRTETDYDKMYRAMGFSEEAVKSGKIRLSYGNGWHFFYTCGEEKREIETDEMKKFNYDVRTECFAIKMETLWDSSEVYAYPDHDRVLLYIPDIDKYHYVPVNNEILARAEVPFLIFEKNYGKCFIQRG